MAGGFGKRSNTVKRFFLLMGKRYPTIPPSFRQNYFPPRGGVPLWRKKPAKQHLASPIYLHPIYQGWTYWLKSFEIDFIEVLWLHCIEADDDPAGCRMAQVRKSCVNTQRRWTIPVRNGLILTKAHIPRKSNNSRGIVVRIFYRQVEKKYLSRYIIIWKSRLHFRHPSSFRWWQHVLSRGFLATSAISVAASAAYAPSWGKHSRSSLSLQTLLGANILDQALGRWPGLRRRNPSPWELTSKPWQGSPSLNLRRRGQRLRIGWGEGGVTIIWGLILQF